MHRAALFLLALAPAATAAPPRHVLELFTSQSCSSCPPADALLAALAATRPDVLALDFHVDYWDHLGWKDPFSSPRATRRQEAYAARLGTETYTPELVIDGARAVVGSDRRAVEAALAAPPPNAAALRVARTQGGLAIAVDRGSGRGRVLLVGFDPRHETPVAGGENAGRRLTEVNVVRAFGEIGTWSGAPAAFSAPVPAGERCAVVIQATSGAVLGSAEC